MPESSRRAALAGAFLTIGLAIGGAAVATAVPPVPLIRDANMANAATNDRELNIVVDPADPDHLAAGANMRGGPNGQRWYVSTNGGRTWTTGALPYGTIASGTDNGTNTLMSDPGLDFDSEGDIYYSALAHGGSSDPCDLFVSTSADDGANWTDPASGLVADGGASICHDKQFILVDRAQNDNVYVAWTPFGGANDRELVFSRDTGGNDDGLSFSAPIVLSTDSSQDGDQNHGGELALQADGDLYVAWTTFDNGLGDGADSSIWMARSANQGASFAAPIKVADLDNVAPTPAAGFRARSFPSIVADPATGRLFIVWADYNGADGDDADIFYSTSSNDGANWSSPAEVDVESDTDTQVMPWVQVADGRVDVGFYSLDDSGTSPTNDWNTFLAYGAVGASPAFTQVRVSSVGTDVSTGFIGDYLGAASLGEQKVHLAWGDGRTGVGGATDGFYGLVDFSPPQVVSGSVSPAILYWGDTATITAHVTGLGGEDEAHIPVSFTVTSTGTPSATSGGGTTGANGRVSFSYSNGTGGTDTVSIWADLDENGAHDSGETVSVSVPWQKHPTTATYTGPVVGEYHDPLTVSGTLVDALGSTPIVGRTLTLGFGTDTCAGTTDGTGTASCSLTPEQVPAAYTAYATFAGDGQYEGTTSVGVAFTLNKEQTQLIDLLPPFAGNGDTVAFSATLVEDDPTPVGGRAVTFTLGTGGSAQTCTDPATDTTGLATCTIVVSQPVGPTTLTAAFDGDAYYLATASTRSVVVFSWTPGGNFVIGDGNDTTGATATFWADDWYLRNSVSGGIAPSSFKGFSNIPAGKTTCGGTWSTGGGNSPPPAGAVPQYTAVLVTDRATKKGKVISGTKPIIVVVRVNPGYAPSPGKRGTAEVLGQLCP